MESNITEKKLLELLRQSDHHLVSLYLPTHQDGTEVRQDITRFKNNLNQAEDQLISHGLRTAESRSFLEQAFHLLHDDSFWHHLSRGLALFISENHFEMMRLPLHFQEMVLTGNRFYIKPLLRLFNENERFYLLAVSVNSCRVFLGTRDALTKISVKGLPDGMDETLRYDDPERQLQFHTGTAPRSGERAAMYHGQGVGKDDSLENKRRYLRQVDHAVNDLLGPNSTPLLFVGVDSLCSVFKEVSTNTSLLDDFVAGNPDLLKPRELHRKAWPLVEHHARERMHNALDRYQEHAGTDIASADLRAILNCAFQGRVETLFIAAHEQVWGRHDPRHDQVVLHDKRLNGDDELIDAAAVHTLLKGGSVYVLEDRRRTGGPVAALFRY
jgi:hypothetical protein